jgi:type VI secretion system protein VasG
MRGTILPQISREILTRMGQGEMPAQINLGLAEDGSFRIDFGG